MEYLLGVITWDDNEGDGGCVEIRGWWGLKICRRFGNNDINDEYVQIDRIVEEDGDCIRILRIIAIYFDYAVEEIFLIVY